jgi:hypothetical protein
MSRLKGAGKLVVSMVIGAIVFSVVVHFTGSPPLRVLSLAEQGEVTLQGARLELAVSRLSDKRCDVHTDRELWRWEIRNGERIRVVVPLPFRSNVIVPDGEEKYIVSMDVPATIGPGQWFFVAQSRFDCGWLPGWFEHDVIRTADVPITITGRSTEVLP